MQIPDRIIGPVDRSILFLLPFLSLSLTVVGAADPHVIVPGYERFRANGLSDVEGGQLLLSELNCRSCHGDRTSDRADGRRAPILTDLGSRVHPEFLSTYLNNPQAIKPGTAMPEILHGTDPETLEALTHFLMSRGAVVPSPATTERVRRGEKLFHSVGCAACHGDLKKAADERSSWIMPLGRLDSKYTVSSLVTFLQNPHAVRPSGRMPSLNLTDEEARDVASYLLQDIDVEPTLTFDYYEGNWDSLPNFDTLTPKSSGSASSFDPASAPKKNQFALRFKAYLHLPGDGEYQFWLGSDDGSRLIIDDQEVILNDGVHPHSVRDGKQTLSGGAHRIVVEYFEGGGEESLAVEIQGPGIARQPVEGLCSTNDQPPEQRRRFQVNEELVAKGQKLFVAVGCASCHEHDATKEAAGDSQALLKAAPEFSAAMNVTAGCLASDRSQLPAGVPAFQLTSQQISDIGAAIRSNARQGDFEPSAQQQIAATLLTLNCYACHQRDGRGGVPREQDDLFVGTIPEMGDEGRIPPHLDGAGDKLQENWLKHILNQGAKDRPYMLTRMPKFGEQNVGPLVSLLAKTDQRTEVSDVTFEDPDHRIIAEARLMVGDQALSCIKCHIFDKYKAIGIQSLDMTTMTRRLRRDWFHRYLLNPQAYRPGTRMPAAWPNGRSVVPKILHGNSDQQIEAIWRYLSDGTRAKIPSGLIAEAIELKPVDRPIIYRNFIEGLSARGIAVGYPEGVHLAWDAEQMNLRLIWHGAFIDASKHWVGRGPGYQTPLGDHVMTLVSGQPLAQLAADDQPWPDSSARDAGFRFRGYRLDASGRPEFHWTGLGVSVTEAFLPVPGEKDSSLRRTLTFKADGPVEQLTYRLAAGGSIEPTGAGWLVDKSVRFTVPSGNARVRTVNGRQELVVSLTADQLSGGTTIDCGISW
ncbi:MAG: c-type cytochrome [Planctomycetaceae bacterium]